MFGIYFVLFCIWALGLTVNGGSIRNADFDSGWLDLQARHPVQDRLQVDHGLGEVPILVDVQVKSLEDPNMDFLFPAVGSRPRDDDEYTDFGGVLYIYNNQSVIISAPSTSNDHSGYAIYTGEGTYYTGINQQASLQVQVRVRAYLTSSLPVPDFNLTGIPLTAASNNVNDTYVEVPHGLGEYPELAKVRTRLTDGSYAGWYSDGVGSSMVVYPTHPSYTWSAYVIYGYNNDTVRIWVSSLDKDKLFDGTDGYDINGKSMTGEAEIVAWKLDTLHYTFKFWVWIGPYYINELTEFQYGYNFTSDLYLVSTVEATGGPNLGYRFPGSGAHAYTTAQTDPVCSYGGLTYGYTETAIRWWRPDPVINGGLICIASIYGNGTNAQVDPYGKTVTSLWASSWEKFPDKPKVELSRFPHGRPGRVFSWPITLFLFIDFLLLFLLLLLLGKLVGKDSGWT